VSRLRRLTLSEEAAADRLGRTRARRQLADEPSWNPQTSCFDHGQQYQKLIDTWRRRVPHIELRAHIRSAIPLGLHGTFETARNQALRLLFGAKARLDFLVSYVAKTWVERPGGEPLERNGARGAVRIFLGHPEVRASLQAQWNEKPQRRTSRRLG
jgi:hypothetical protein